MTVSPSQGCQGDEGGPVWDSGWMEVFWEPDGLWPVFLLRWGEFRNRWALDTTTHRPDSFMLILPGSVLFGTHPRCCESLFWSPWCGVETYKHEVQFSSFRSVGHRNICRGRKFTWGGDKSSPCANTVMKHLCFQFSSWRGRLNPWAKQERNTWKSRKRKQANKDLPSLTLTVNLIHCFQGLLGVHYKTILTKKDLLASV